MFNVLIHAVIHIMIYLFVWTFTMLLIKLFIGLKEPFLFEGKPIFFLLVSIPIALIFYAGIVMIFIGG